MGPGSVQRRLQSGRTRTAAHRSTQHSTQSALAGREVGGGVASSKGSIAGCADPCMSVRAKVPAGTGSGRRLALIFVGVALVLALDGCSHFEAFTLPLQPGGRESTLRWEPHAKPVLARGGTGEWDSVDVLNPSIVQHAGLYYNLYSGFDARPGTPASPLLPTACVGPRWARCSPRARSPGRDPISRPTAPLCSQGRSSSTGIRPAHPRASAWRAAETRCNGCVRRSRC